MEDEDRYTRITLRIPKDLHGQLVYQAEQSSKSLNAQILEGLNDASTLKAVRAVLSNTRERVTALEAEVAAVTETAVQLADRLERQQEELNLHRRASSRRRGLIETLKARLQLAEDRAAREMEVDRVQRLLAQIVLAGLKALLRRPHPETLNVPDVVAAKTLVERIDAGGLGVASHLAQTPGLDDQFKRALEGYAAYENPPLASTGDDPSK